MKERIILDTGLIPNTKGSKVYAIVKGVSDAGLQINFDEKVIPSEERLVGKDTKVQEEFNKLKGVIEKI